VTEQLLAQPLESPSVTGRDDPEMTSTNRPAITTANHKVWTKAFSLGNLR